MTIKACCASSVSPNSCCPALGYPGRSQFAALELAARDDEVRAALGKRAGHCQTESAAATGDHHIGFVALDATHRIGDGVGGGGAGRGDSGAGAAQTEVDRDIAGSGVPHHLRDDEWADAAGTAVADRSADASEVRSVVECLCACGVDVAIVSGTHIGNVDAQLAARPRGPGRFLMALNRGSELFEVGGDGPRLLERREPTTQEESALTRTLLPRASTLSVKGVELVESELIFRNLRIVGSTFLRNFQLAFCRILSSA